MVDFTFRVIHETMFDTIYTVSSKSWYKWSRGDSTYKNNIFSFKALFSRKISLKTYQVPPVY